MKRHKIKVTKGKMKYEFVGEGKTSEDARENALAQLRRLKLEEKYITYDSPIEY